MPTHPEVGDPAPLFSLPSSEGTVSLAERLRNGPVLLVFFPADNTLVCTRQLCNYRDNLSVFEDLGVQLVALNHDPLETHQAFSRRYKFPFPLCSDADRQVSNAYGALLELWKMHRVLVLVGEDGRIWWRHRVLRAFYKNAADLERVIRELQSAR
jgi:peroxiredoxin Q/BCP